MVRGFIAGLVLGLILLVGLMVLFPMSEAPTGGETMQTTPAPEAGAPEEGAGEGAETGGDAGAATEGETEAGGDAAPAEEPATEDDQSSAPAASEEGETAALAEPGADAADAAGDTASLASAATEEAGSGAEPGGLRLPTVARPEDTLRASAGDPADLPAWRRNAIAFEAEDDRPLLAVVLTALPGAAASRTPLGDVAAPLTLAVAPGSSESPNAARLYRRAGFETMLLLTFSPSEGGGIAPGLSDAEIAETVRGLIKSFDSVVGVANPGAEKNAEMRVARVVMEELSAEGLAYLHALGGAAAGAEVRAARESGVPMARRARVIADGLDTAEILQSLDLAAFDARRRGAAVAIGAPSEAMVQALIEWARENNGRAARLAPFSAVLARLAQEG